MPKKPPDSQPLAQGFTDHLASVQRRFDAARSRPNQAAKPAQSSPPPPPRQTQKQSHQDPDEYSFRRAKRLNLSKHDDKPAKKSVKDLDNARVASLDSRHKEAYNALKRKVETYDQIKNGTHCDDDAPNSSLLLLPDPDRPVEIVDEYGRSRTVKASERHLYLTATQNAGADTPDVSDPAGPSGTSGAVPVPASSLIRGHYVQTAMFKLDEAAAAAIHGGARYADDRRAEHYDRDWDRARVHGPGFYSLDAADESARLKQMQDLDARRRETTQIRKSQENNAASDNDGDNDGDADYHAVKKQRTEYRDKVAERRTKIAKLREQQLSKMQHFVKSKDNL